MATEAPPTEAELGFEDEDQGTSDPGAIEHPWPINIVKAERTIFELHRQWRSGRLRLSPDYQRDFVWKPERQVRLVESVMARVPLPVFYLSEESEEELLVVDGQQRLTTLFAFIEGWFPDKTHASVIRLREEKRGNKFQLKGLKLMPELDGQAFADLSPKLQRRFEEAPLTCFIIQKGTATSVKYELFDRLNQGATPLNFQEIRNALFRGPGLTLVKDLAEEGGRFRAVAGARRRYDRRRADELVLRGLSFLWKGWGDGSYKGDLQAFLNECLKDLNARSEDELGKLRASVLHALDVVQTVFAERAFQRFDPERNLYAGHVSGPLVEVEIAVLGQTYRDRLPSSGEADRLRATFEELCRGTAFQDAILKATQTRKNLDLRMRRFEEIVRHAAQLEP